MCEKAGQKPVEHAAFRTLHTKYVGARKPPEQLDTPSPSLADSLMQVVTRRQSITTTIYIFGNPDYGDGNTDSPSLPTATQKPSMLCSATFFHVHCCGGGGGGELPC